jgi:hypothetical protein
MDYKDFRTKVLLDHPKNIIRLLQPIHLKPDIDNNTAKLDNFMINFGRLSNPGLINVINDGLNNKENQKLKTKAENYFKVMTAPYDIFTVWCLIYNQTPSGVRKLLLPNTVKYYTDLIVSEYSDFTFEKSKTFMNNYINYISTPPSNSEFEKVEFYGLKVYPKLMEEIELDFDNKKEQLLSSFGSRHRRKMSRRGARSTSKKNSKRNSKEKTKLKKYLNTLRSI